MMNKRYISSEEMKANQLKILQYINDFCSDNNITYFLFYGSLIGAVRHKGIIPWDDDIDICMNRQDYNNFVNTFPRNSTNYVYIREQSIDPEFPFYYSKICLNNTHAYEPIDNRDYDVGISIDLFPLDFVPNSFYKRIKQKAIIKLNRIKLIPHTIDTKCNRNLFKKFCISLLNFIFRKPAYFYINNIRKCITTIRTDECEYVTEVMTPYGKKAIFPKEWFQSYILHSFEGMMIPIPVEYNRILTQLYGDYMSPPPVEQQISHHSCHAFVDSEQDNL